MGVGFCVGAWWQYEIARSKIAAAEGEAVQMHDAFKTTLSVDNAATWLELMRMNPDVRGMLRTCQPVQQPSGKACSFTFWTQLPAVANK